MNGYTKIPNELMRNPLLSPTEKTVWGVIASMAPGYRPTIATYCAMVQCHINTWRAVIKKLRGFGMVTVEHSGNRVRYDVVTEPSKWTLPNNICEGNKICDHNNNCEGKGNNNCEGHPNKICDPIEEHIEEQKKTIAAARVRAREESIILRLKIYDDWSESICMKHHIDPARWGEMVDAFMLDMRCRNQDMTQITDIRAYFNGWIIKEQNNGQRTDKNQRALEAGARAIAALAAQSGKPVDAPF